MRKLLEVKEYDLITCKEVSNQYKYLEEKSFKELEELILSFGDEDADAMDFFSISTKRNIGKVIRVKNYVGIVHLKDGTQIQILPKIDSEKVDAKRIFLKMLKSMRNFPCKVFSETSLSIERMSLYEIFISLYIQETRNLVKHGLMSAYNPVEMNSNFYKGKLVINEHVKRNIVHKERFYVNFDEFNVNRVENKLIKSTLLKLSKVSTSSKNVKEIRQLLQSFEMVQPSSHYDRDFSEVVSGRNTKDYEILMRWSEVFLLNKSFSTFSGNSLGKSLLFPMERVFEEYVGRNLKHGLSGSDWDVSLQDRGYYLFDRKFALRPDIVVEKSDKSRKIILDTKWKILSNDVRSNYGISQSDMYQMYAYAKKYQTDEIYLVYPKCKGVSDDIQFTSDDGVRVSVFFIDLSDIEGSINKLISKLNKVRNDNVLEAAK